MHRQSLILAQSPLLPMSSIPGRATRLRSSARSPMLPHRRPVLPLPLKPGRTSCALAIVWSLAPHYLMWGHTKPLAHFLPPSRSGGFRTTLSLATGTLCLTWCDTAHRSANARSRTGRARRADGRPRRRVASGGAEPKTDWRGDAPECEPRRLPEWAARRSMFEG